MRCFINHALKFKYSTRYNKSYAKINFTRLVIGSNCVE